MKRFLERLGPRPLSTIPMWRKITRLKNQRRGGEMPTLIKDENEYTTNEEKAKLFEEKMIKVFNEANENSFDKDLKEKIDRRVESKDYEKEYTNKDVKFVTMGELEKQIRKMNNKTSIDEFGLSNMILKNMPYLAKEFFLTIINKCLTVEMLPSRWKTSIIKMIPKKSDNKHDIDNYRPISITPCIMRLFERIILERLKNHLDANNIIVKQQSGFRQNRSTRDNLFFLIQKTHESFNRNKSVVAIFFDIAAAFDKVWHNGLIDKLIKIKTPLYLLKIIIAFLSDRKFRIKVGNFTTKLNDIKCGVPQGACLGPTLFSVYINDAPGRNKKNTENTVIFADDLGYFLFFKKMTQKILDKINLYLSQLNEWAKKWRLTLAANKCNYMIFTRKNKVKSDVEINLIP